MEYWRHGRTVVALGGIFNTAEKALEFTGEFELDSLNCRTREMRFAVDEEGLLRLEIGEQSYFLSYTALQDLCKLLKVPASFINKFPPSTLMLENLNRNPYLQEENIAVRLNLWKWEEHPVIAGIMLQEIPTIPIKDYLQMQVDYDMFTRNGVETDSIVITGEEVVVYFLLEEEMSDSGFLFRAGYALHFSPTRVMDTVVVPFYRMQVTAPTGEPFDFDFESGKKIRVARRKKKDFLELTNRFATSYNGEDLGIDFNNTLRKGQMCREISSLRFGLVKTLKSRATSIFNYHGMRAEPGLVTEEIIPEYRQFLSANRERLKQMENYEVNRLPVDFYLPLYFNRIFTFPPTAENPYFLLKSRKTTGALLEKLLEEVGE